MCQTTILPQSLDECSRGSVNASAKNDYGGFGEFTKMAMNESEYTCENDARVITKNFDNENMPQSSNKHFKYWICTITPQLKWNIALNV